MKDKVNMIDILCDAIEKSNVKVTFGLTEKNIEIIENEIKRWDNMIEEGDKLKKGWIKYDRNFWIKIAGIVGWEPLSISLYYFEYLHKNQLNTHTNVK